MNDTRSVDHRAGRQGPGRTLWPLIAAAAAGLIPMPAPATTSGAALSGQTPAIAYTALEKIAEREHLSALPPAVQNERLNGWRSAFVADLTRNQYLVSDAALLILEALLREDSAAASSLLQRYRNGTAGEGPSFPEALQESLSPESALRLTRLAAKHPNHGEDAVTINLHPFWWGDAGCQVAINGVPVASRQGATALGGRPFYIQRICQDPRLNRLATGQVPQGMTMLFVAFRAQEDVDGAALRNADNGRLTAEALVGPLWGHQGSIGLRSGSADVPPVFLGLRLASDNGWSFQMGGAQLRQKAPPAQEEAALTEPSAEGASNDRLFARIAIERRFLVASKDLTLGRLAIGPLLGMGLTGLHLDGQRTGNWEFLAPTLAAGTELLWMMRLSEDHDFEVGLRPALTIATPPMRGVTREVFLVMGVTF